MTIKEKRAKRAAYVRRWNRKNRAKKNAADSRWRKKNPEKVALYSRRTRLKHPRTTYMRKRKAEASAWLTTIKLRAGCLDCGSRERLEFDHRNPAKKRFGIGQAKSYARATLLAEIKKCVVRCRACHMKRHGREWRAA